ncbi:hypothetical protein [Ensifer sp. LCM 4579]|nr:hypothetical protein [Ensifer sp. LCM 4579]
MMTFDDDVEVAIAAACEELEMTQDEIIRLILSRMAGAVRLSTLP